MKVGSLVMLFALSLFAPAGVVRADDCVSACVQQCLDASSTLGTAKKCGQACVQNCRQDLTAPQNVFKGPVTATPLCASTSDSCGFSVQGTVANQGFCPGTVTFYAICPGSSPETNVIGSTGVSADCTFSLTMPSTYSGENGCYGLVAVTPPDSSTDPGWSTCSGASCPNPVR